MSEDHIKDSELRGIAREVERRIGDLERDTVNREVFEAKMETMLGKLAPITVDLKNVRSDVDEIKKEQQFARRLLVTQLLGFLATVAAGVIIFFATKGP